MTVFEIGAKLSFDMKGFKEGLSSASESVNSFASKTKEILGATARAASATVGAVSAGIGAIVKQSVDAYGDYEQLVGGIETLFGDSAAKVLENSEKAFKTAGMSMNDYMETSIQSAASLINSLSGDQAKAAELMDMSISDMSDKMSVRVKRIELYQRCA